MKSKPDFFLSAAGEMKGNLAIPRACWNRGRLRDAVRDDHMLIEVAPAVPGQEYGLGCEDISELILSTRHEGFSLFPVTEWPSYVYIARILDRTVFETLTFTKAQVEIIGWGMIFRTANEAKANLEKFVL